jgi:hypothetical protein
MLQLTWTPSDQHPDSYQVYVDSTDVYGTPQEWDGGAIVFEIEIQEAVEL